MRMANDRLIVLGQNQSIPKTKEEEIRLRDRIKELWRREEIYWKQRPRRREEIYYKQGSGQYFFAPNNNNLKKKKPNIPNK